MEQVDRRAFMQKAGIAGVAAAGVWAAPSVLGASTAFAAGSLVNCTGLTWGTTTLRPNATGTGTPSTVPSTSTARVFYARILAVGTSPAINVKVTVTPTSTSAGDPGAPGTGSGNNGGVNATVPYPGTNPGGLNGNNQYYALNMDNAGPNRGYRVTFEFQNSAGNASVNVYNLKFTLYDIDLDTNSNNNYKDAVWLSTPPSSVTAGANVTGGGTSTSPWTGNSTTAPTGVIDQSGNVAITYTGPIATTSVTYHSDNPRNADNDIQYIGISNLSWCY